MKGEVIGVATFYLIKGQNINFAIPGDRVIALITEHKLEKELREFRAEREKLETERKRLEEERRKAEEEKRNAEEANQVRKAADQGDARAQTNLGSMYANMRKRTVMNTTIQSVTPGNIATTLFEH